MRINLPVTQQVFQFPEGVTLVSTTDLDSRITYCNPAFIAVSGYAREELIGQPHNLIRHPDMPAEAFRDMWATLQSGAPWSAVVKNRRKNGDHYWVLANATPVVEGDRPVGYMSVRTRPTAGQIEAAEVLYAAMRREAETGQPAVALHQGGVVRLGWAGWVQHLTRLTPGRRMAAMTLVLVLAVLGVSHLSQGLGADGRLAVLVACALLAVGAGFLMWRVMSAPLRELVGFANRMAAGNLTARLDMQAQGELGELARALNQLNVNLQAVVSDVRHEVGSVQVAAAEIASGNHDLSSRTETQASSLEQTAASLDQINSTVQHAAASAREVSRLAVEAAGGADESIRAVAQLAGTMDQISQASSRIGEIIRVIDGISFQTNILALNASVEAARAGEQGRGFAVVATEVRELSRRTLEAAEDIKSLIEDSIAKVALGSQQVHQTGKTIQNMGQTVVQVRTLIGEISIASQEQSSGVSQINQAVSHMDAVTQQNAAMVEQLAAAASSLQAQAQVVEEAVRIFRL